MDDQIWAEGDLSVKTVTCHTEGCENDGLPITFLCADIVMCGVCNQQIADVVPGGDEG